MKAWIVIDIATAPLAEAEQYLEGVVRAPSNYKQQEAIDAYIAEKKAERLLMAATDIDLARITGLATKGHDFASVDMCRTEDDERLHLSDLASDLESLRRNAGAIITFGGFSFDLPLLMRRAKYLGVDFPTLNLDRFKSPHLDLCEVLSDRNPQRKRSLDFYCQRMGWTDLMPKPLAGADEAKVHTSERWDDLAESLRRDAEATYRLAQWFGVIGSAA